MISNMASPKMSLSEAYKILGLEYKSPIAQVKSAYKVLSRKYHPDKCRDVAPNKFLQIKEAFNYILSLESSLSPLEKPTQPTYQLSPNEYDLWLTLEEILSGNDNKSVPITRMITDENGNKRHEKVFINVPVKAGLTEANRITVREEGDQEHSKIAANAVFIVRQERHKIFNISAKSKFDLEYTAKVTNMEALLGCQLKIPTLEDVFENFNITGVITKDTVHKITNRGLPYPDMHQKRGDLIVLFNIIQPKPKDPSIEHNLDLTLEQILNGCVKKCQIQRSIIDLDGLETFEDKTLSINIEPGTEAGTKFTFPELGDQNPDIIPADLIFIACNKPHSRFKRDGVHIVTTALITPKEEKLGCQLSIQTLENDSVTLSLEGIIDVTKKHKIEGRGLPYPNNSKKRGDLLVQFELAKQNELDKMNLDEITPELPQDPPVEQELQISLEDILNGRTKTLKINREVYSNGSVKYEDKIVKIEIKPGTEDGFRYTFPMEGDQRPGIIPADIVFVVKYKPHDLFVPQGIDLNYEAHISHKNLATNSIEIPTLDGYIVQMKIPDLVTRDKSTRIPGHGLPHMNKNKIRGDLVVHYVDDLRVLANANSPDNESVHQSLPSAIVIFQKHEMEKENPTDIFLRKNHFEPNRSIDKDQNCKSQLAPPCLDLPLTIQEMVNGCTKERKIKRQIWQKDGTMCFENKVLNINVKPGIEIGEKIVFNGEGDQVYGMVPTDVIFVVVKENRIDVTYLKTPHNLQIFPRQQPSQTQVPQNKFLTNSTKPIQEIQTHSKLVSPTPPKLPKDPKIEFPLELTLKNLMFGCVIDYKSKINDKEIIFPIKVEPGTLPGTKYTFPNASHQYHGRIPADVVFIVRVLEHPCFKIEESTLFYTALITQSEAQNGIQLEIPTPDGEPMKKTFSGPIKNGSVKTYRNRGLPDSNNPQERGSLAVRFEIVGDQFKDPPIEERIELSLESILYGCKKEIKYNRNYFDLEGIEQMTEKKITIDIKPGAETGLIYYPRKGIYNPGRIPADIEITVCEAKHPYFTRRGNDIEYIAKIMQSDLQQKKVVIPTLDKSKIDLPIGNETVKNPIQRIPAFGFPDASGKRGDLVVHFEIIGGPVNDNAIKATQKLQNVPDEMEYNLAITLEEIINGNIKYVAVRDEYGKDTGKKNKIIIRPGHVAGTKLYYETRGQQKLVIIFEEKEHKNFTRIGLDIDYKAQISLKEALCGGKVQIPKLEKITTNTNIPLVKVVNPDKPTIIPNRGIPDINNPKKRGNMVVSWKVQFPNKLSKEDKIELSQIFHQTFERYLSYRDKIKILNKVSAKPIPPKNKSNNSNSNKNPSVEHEVSLSLEDILRGSSNSYQIPRTVIDSNGGKRNDSKAFKVMLNPGQIKAIFPREGNHISGPTPSDIVFTVIDAPHSIFKRVNQADIQCTALITLQEALCGFKLRVPSLEKNLEKVELMFGLDDDSVMPHKEKYKIAGLGLPYPDNPNRRGDLIVQFEIIFPDELSKEQKTKIGRILNV